MLEQQPGPPRLRSRDDRERFGYDHLSIAQQQKADGDTALFLKQLGLYMHAEESWDENLWPHMKGVKNRVGFLLESPQDPDSYLPNGEGSQSASFWAWEETSSFLEEYKPQGMTLIHFDQGCFGHPRKKPTTCMTNLPDMGDLDGCRSGTYERALANNIEERLNQTASWSMWAPGFRAAVKVSILVLLGWYGFSKPQLSKSLGIDQWKQHINQGHQPYRRDCRTCILNMAASKPHRRREHAGTSAWSMSIDLVNLPRARDLACNRTVRYALVATALVPVFDEKENSTPVDETGCDEKGTATPVDENGAGKEKEPPKKVDLGVNSCREEFEVLDHSWGEGMNDEEFDLGGHEDEKEVETPKEGDETQDLGKGNELGLEECPYEPTTDEEMEYRNPEAPKDPSQGVEDEIRELSRPLRVRHVTLMEPVETRNVAHVLPAMDRIVTRMRYMGICVTRIHSDRAKELLSRKFRGWVTQRNMFHSFTAGDDPQSNGHCESEVNQLKRRTRLLLSVAGQNSAQWPQAMRYATEERLRYQMNALGSPVCNMLPYNARVLVKRKRWHDKGNLLAQPFVETNLLCPSPDMSNGWLVQTIQDQHVLHAREVILPDPLGDQAQIELQEEQNPGKPKHRLWGKQSLNPRSPMKLPVFPREHRGGESLGSKIDGNDGNKTENEGEMGNGEEMDMERCFDEPPKKVVKKMEIDCSRVVKTENLEGRERALEKTHKGINATLQELLDVVPINRNLGEMCGKTIQWLQSEREELERDLFCLREVQTQRSVRICGFQANPDELPDQGEVLQTTTISLNEVRANLNDWKDAMRMEYHSLIHETRAIEPIMMSELDPVKVEFVPGKLVTVRKAGPQGGKKKCRAVVCGNLLQSDLDPAPGSLYASGADGVLIRTTLAHSVQRGWGIGLTDIKTAFLLAPRPKPSGSREVIVVPPKIMVEGGICHPQERWRVHHALYGFTSSPAHWAVHRDSTMMGFQWEDEHGKYYLKRTSEGNLWKIMRQQGLEKDVGTPALPLGDDPESNDDVEPPQSFGERDSCEGHVIVYVDDIMALATEEVRKSFFNRVQQEWKCSGVETVNEQEWVRFCGFELKRHEDGRSLKVGQKSYTAELMKRHEGITPKQCPIPKNDGLEIEETEITTEQIRAAQAITGELLWLSVRSRPDISYAISVMSRNVSRRPRWVQQLGKHMLGFLESTKEACIVYRPCNNDHGSSGLLQVPRHDRLLEAFADISYAPQGDRSHQGIIIFAAGAPIHWEATRQAFHTMSTAESELVGYCEATTMLKSAEALMKVIHAPMPSDVSFEKVIYGDNSSALSILVNPDGGWRTRHLRLRSSCLRELLREEPQNWKVRHQKGVDLPADMLTKPIVLQREWIKFWDFLGFLIDSGKKSTKNEVNSPVFESPPKPIDTWAGTTTTKGFDAAKKVQVVVTMAALAVAAATAAGADTKKACATAVVACAGWLAIYGDPSSSRRRDPSCDMTSDGREEEETKRNKTRAMGLKKCQDARGNEPAIEKRSPKENELGDSRGPTLRENEPREEKVGKKDPPKSFWNGTSIETTKDKGEPSKLKFCGEELTKGSNVVKAKQTGREHCGMGDQVISMTPRSFSDQEYGISVIDRPYHCPTGCPKSSVPSCASAPAMGEQSMQVAGAKVAALRVTSGTSEDVPWMETMFMNPPSTRKDQWLVTMVEEGWLIRAHGGGRVRRFHPLHKNVPIDPQDLDGTRVSVGFNSRGVKMVATDKWTDPPSNLWEPKAEWTGWTFLRLKKQEPSRSDGDQKRESQLGAGRVAASSGLSSKDLVNSSSGASEDLLPWVTIGGVRLDLQDEPSAVRTTPSEPSDTREEKRGYARGTAVDRGEAVAKQLPLPYTEVEFSDEDEWEQVSDL